MRIYINGIFTEVEKKEVEGVLKLMEDLEEFGVEELNIGEKLFFAPFQLTDAVEYIECFTSAYNCTSIREVAKDLKNLIEDLEY